MSADFEEWIGRSLTRRDVAGERLAAEFRATLAPFLFETGACPPGFHFALAPAIPAPDETGPDGAEAKGLFLPPFPLPRRMWAGGVIESLAPIPPGAAITRRSAIAEIKRRDGKAGPLYLCAVDHEIAADGVLAVRERQDLLFRAGGPAAAPALAPVMAADVSWRIEATALLLFRFSALTFNGHRIHYDLDYARNVEGYAGLLVHGPLQASLLLNQAAAALGKVPQRFQYRCLAPLLSGQTFTVETRRDGTGAAGRIIDHHGIATCEASA